MPELRFDYTAADWVVFAPLRQLRPHVGVGERAVISGPPGSPAPACPFCPGGEAMTPHEIDADRVSEGGVSKWLVRVIPNKFPALQIEEDVRRVEQGEVFRKMGGCGAHEVVIESPDHDRVLAAQPLEQIERVLRVVQRRSGDLMRDLRFQAVIAFKNHGDRAGTSLQHPHWQIIATPVVPHLLRLRCREAAEYYDRTGVSLYEVILREELRIERRVIAVNSEFVAFLPYAGHLPFEMWIFPRRPQASFQQLQPEQFRPLAQTLQVALMKLYVGLENPDFNLTIDTAPRGEEGEPWFRWHIRILPRLSTAAGFELGSGMAINTVLPESAADFLRAGNGIVAT